MTKTSWLSAGLAAGLGFLLLGPASAIAQTPPAVPANAGELPAATDEAMLPRGTATTVLPTLPPPSSTLDVVRRRGVLRVGVATYVPWVMHSKSGELIGFEIDVANRLAADLGVKPEFVMSSYPSLLDDLLEDRFDIIVTGMSITPARALVANFSIPVAESFARLLANKKKAAGITTAAGFDRPEVTIGVRAGAIGMEVAKRSFPKAKIQPIEDEDALIDAVLAGTVTAAVAWSPGPEFLIAKAGDKLSLPLAEPLARSREAIAVRKGDHDLLAFLDAWIRYQQDTDWLAERRKYWFDGFAWEEQL
jgi:polar amino acid transport system substrate-binding protein